MKRNIWYNQQITGNMQPLVTELDQILYTDSIVKLSDSDVEEIKNILEAEYSKGQHRCISVYRDAVILDDKIYNLCLSCGDVITDTGVKYFTSDQENKLKEIKKKLYPNL